MVKKKISTKAAIYYICCAIIGLIIGIWVAGRLSKPNWQTTQDEEIQFQKNEGDLDGYILTRFVMSLEPNGQVRYLDSHGEAYSNQDLYDYVSKVTGYKCEKLSDYSDDKPYNKIAKCEKI